MIKTLRMKKPKQPKCPKCKVVVYHMNKRRSQYLCDKCDCVYDTDELI